MSLQAVQNKGFYSKSTFTGFSSSIKRLFMETITSMGPLWCHEDSDTVLMIFWDQQKALAGHSSKMKRVWCTAQGWCICSELMCLELFSAHTVGGRRPRSSQKYTDLVPKAAGFFIALRYKGGPRRRNKSNVIEKINKSNGNCARRSPNQRGKPESRQTNWRWHGEFYLSLWENRPRTPIALQPPPTKKTEGSQDGDGGTGGGSVCVCVCGRGQPSVKGK